jgi:hypothetical protein
VTPSSLNGLGGTACPGGVEQQVEVLEAAGRRPSSRTCLPRAVLVSGEAASCVKLLRVGLHDPGQVTVAVAVATGQLQPSPFTPLSPADRGGERGERCGAPVAIPSGDPCVSSESGGSPPDAILATPLTDGIPSSLRLALTNCRQPDRP